MKLILLELFIIVITSITTHVLCSILWIYRISQLDDYIIVYSILLIVSMYNIYLYSLEETKQNIRIFKQNKGIE